MDLDTTGMLPREQIQQDRSNCERWIQLLEGSTFRQGAIAVYDWLLGVAPAPISGVTASTRDAVKNEEQLAHQAIYGVRGAPEVISQDWAVGVEHACLWVRGLTEDPPGGPLPSDEDD